MAGHDSSHHAGHPPPPAPEPPYEKRRRAAGSAAAAQAASSRAVAHLTPEQLARKRANDREAQRAIRERNKAQIETLKQKIHELESQEPFQTLQAALRQKDAVQAENDDIRRRLVTVINTIQPVLHSSRGLNGMPIAPLLPISS